MDADANTTADLADYRIVRRLALGGMAEVFLAQRLGEGVRETVALKRMLPELSDDPTFVRMFHDEACLSQRLLHPNIVRTQAVGAQDGLPFMVLDYIDGTDLRRFFALLARAGQSLAVPDVVALGISVARGLAYAHALTDGDGAPLRIVHRDVSPHNILLGRDGAVVLTDFGIAHATQRSVRTMSGVVKGKLAYMAPEQAAGEPVDGRCDQFALALILWECLAGRRARVAPSDALLLRAVIAGEVPDLASMRADVSPALRAVLARALARQPQARFAAMADFAAALADSTPQVLAGTAAIGAWVRALVPALQEGVTSEVAMRSGRVTRGAPTLVPQRGQRAARAEHLWIGPLVTVALLGLAATVAQSSADGPLQVPAQPSADAGPVLASLDVLPPTGFLSLRSHGPWVDVYLGAHKLGTTPLQRVVVPADDVCLRLVNTLAGVDKALCVTVRRDTELRHTVDVSAL